MSDNKGMNTPYDDAFKSIIKKCPTMTLPLINELFYQRHLIDEEYTGAERVQLLDTELPSMTSPDLAMDSRVVVYGKIRRVFHLECQSTADGSIVLRMIRYDTEEALAEASGSYIGDRISIKLDDSGVFFLRSTKNTPDVMTVNIVAPQGQSLSYQIPVIKMQDYSLDEILRKRLFLMLPFLFFNYEKQLKQLSKQPCLFQEINELFNRIVTSLRLLVEKGTITAYEASTLFDAIEIVLNALGKTNQAEKEVTDIMGGKELVFKADAVYNDGKKAGREEGVEEGRAEERVEGRKTLFQTLCGLILAGNLDESAAAQQLSMSNEEFRTEAQRYGIILA